MGLVLKESLTFGLGGNFDDFSYFTNDLAMFESLFIYINYIIIFQFFENNSERMFYIIIAPWEKLLLLIHML